MTTLIAILAFIFALCLIISLHELGHFIFAKKSGILCYDYSIGMGPVLWSKKKGETTYGIRAIPIGGFVSMAGEGVGIGVINIDQEIGLNLEDDCVKEIILNDIEKAEVFGKVVSFDLYGENSELYIEILVNDEYKKYSVLENALYVESAKKTQQIAPYSRSFESKTLLQRFLTVVAGPAMNFVLAYFLFLIVCFATGVANTKSSVVGGVEKRYSIGGEYVNGPAYEIKKGDKIISINGNPVEDWYDVGEYLDQSIKSESVNIVVSRDGVNIPLTINPIIYVGDIGIMGFSDDVTEQGVRIYIYTTKAKEAGLIDGDIITSISFEGVNYEIKSWADIIDVSDKINGDKITVSYLRGSEAKTAVVNTLDQKTLDVIGIEKYDSIIGISPTYKFSFFGSFVNAFKSIGNCVGEVFGTLGLLFGGSNDVGVSDLSGPIGIFTLIKNSLTGGLISYIAFVAFLSVNIGLLNILPIPALDGGRLVFLAYEAITRKKVNKNVENTIHNIMFILLMLLFVYISFNDVLRLFG